MQTELDWLISALAAASPDHRRRAPETALSGLVLSDSALSDAAILARAHAEGVDAAIHCALHDKPCWRELPEPLRDGLRRAARQAMAWEAACHEALAEVFAAFQSAGLEFLLLKGAGLAYLNYPEPHCRTRGDTDLLFPHHEAADHAWRLLQELGYRRSPGIDGRLVSRQFACFRPGEGSVVTHLDIHWNLSNSSFFAQKLDFARLWGECRAVDALQPGVFTLSARHALIHALFHRAWHIGEGDPDRLIWLYDMHLLCNAFDEAGWRGFVEEVAHCGLEPICREGLRDLTRTLGTRIPGQAHAELALNRSGAGPGQLNLMRPGMRRQLTELRSLPSWSDRLHWLGEHLFPDAAYMRDRFGARRGWRLPYAYVSRFLRGAGKRLRGRAGGHAASQGEWPPPAGRVAHDSAGPRGAPAMNAAVDPLEMAITLNPDVVMQEVEGESVLLHLARSRYFSLDPIGTRAWQLLAEHGAFAEVLRIMQAEYDVEPARLRADLERLLGELSANDLIRLESGDAGAASGPSTD